MAKVILTEWITRKCQVCGQDFEFPDCPYKPETCANPDCIKTNLHPELKKRR